MGRPREETTLLDIREAERAIAELDKRESLKISISDFLRLNLQKLKNYGLSRRTIYENLTSNGLQLGSFKSFSRCWTRVEKNHFISTIPTERDTLRKDSGVTEEIRLKEEPKRDGERGMEVKHELNCSVYIWRGMRSPVA